MECWSSGNPDDHHPTTPALHSCIRPSVPRVGGLYVHVPFCAQKCAYCAFYSEASGGELINRYVAALVREMEMVAHDLQPRTIFFGGGTPSLLNLRQWEEIFRAMDRLNLLGPWNSTVRSPRPVEYQERSPGRVVRGLFHGASDGRLARGIAPCTAQVPVERIIPRAEHYSTGQGPEEFTVECNPATVSLDKARLLRAHGVNRISMGVQSLDETLLERLGRIHTRAMVFRSYDLLRKAGFQNLNLDLMFAIPGQTMKVWRETLTDALALGSEHLSCYEVIYEEDTPLFAQLQAGEFAVDEDLACEMYEELETCASAAGFHQYEVANFAREKRSDGVLECWSNEMTGVQHPITPLLHHSIPAFACRHNVNYWRGGSFYGLGPSATSYVRGVRTKNWSNTQLYCEQLEKGRPAVEFREELAPLSRAGETAAFGLRLVAGWPFAEFRRATGHDLRDEWSADMDDLVERGWGRRSPNHFQLTRHGLRFADAAAEMFLR